MAQRDEGKTSLDNIRGPCALFVWINKKVKMPHNLWGLNRDLSKTQGACFTSL